MEELLARHRKEAKDLLAKEMSLKKAAAKGSKAEQKAKKKEVETAIAEETQAMKERHLAELAALSSLSSESSVATDDAEPVSGPSVSGLSLQALGIGSSTQPAPALRVTKAQKRRQKKVQQENEREQRIKEEQSGGQSERQVEDEQLRAKLAPLGLAVKEVKPDGHCMYRAVEIQLTRGEEAGKSLATPLGTVQLDYLGLRKVAAGFMRGHEQDFAPFAEVEEASSSSEGLFEQYCDNVEHSAAWGGHLELQALSRALGKIIVVHSADAADVVIGQETAPGASVEDTDVIRLSYHRYAYGLGEHYNSVVPLEVQHEEDESLED